MIPFKCQSCKQEMTAPDSQAGQFEACPACNTLVPVPGPNDVPAWGVPPRAPGTANASPDAAGIAHVARRLEQSDANGRRKGGGIERVLEAVGILIAALGLCGIFCGVVLLLITAKEDAAAGYAAISSGVISLPAGLALTALGSTVVELRRIRRLLTEQLAMQVAARK